MTGLASTLATIWRLAVPYFRSEDRMAGRLLLGAVVAIELAIVAITVLINQWNNRFYNALQDRNWDAFVRELTIFCGLAAAFIVLAVYQLYLNQWLQIRWRRWMTKSFLGDWLDGANHYRMQLLGDAADNPDQRLTEDIQMFIERTLTIGIGLLGAVVEAVEHGVERRGDRRRLEPAAHVEISRTLRAELQDVARALEAVERLAVQAVDEELGRLARAFHRLVRDVAARAGLLVERATLREQQRRVEVLVLYILCGCCRCDRQNERERHQGRGYQFHPALR